MSLNLSALSLIMTESSPDAANWFKETSSEYGDENNYTKGMDLHLLLKKNNSSKYIYCF